MEWLFLEKVSMTDPTSVEFIVSTEWYTDIVRRKKNHIRLDAFPEHEIPAFTKNGQATVNKKPLFTNID